MGKTVGVRHYFIEAFTPGGYISYMPNLLNKIKHTYLLLGGPGTGKSTIIKLIGIQLLDRGHELDYLRSIRDPDSVAGIFLPKEQMCLLDVKEFCTDDIDFTEGDVRLIDTNRFCEKSKTSGYKEKIEEIESELFELEEKLLKQLEAEYRSQDLMHEDYLLQHIISKKISDKSSSKKKDFDKVLQTIKKDITSFIFLHALQIEGWINLAPRYLKGYDSICLEEENPDKILRDIFNETRSTGQAVTIIMHPLYANALIGIVFPDKKLAIWRGNPEILYEQDLIGHSKEIIKVLEEYRKKRIELKNIMNKCVNFEGIDKLRTELLNSILAQLV